MVIGGGGEGVVASIRSSIFKYLKVYSFNMHSMSHLCYIYSIYVAQNVKQNAQHVHDVFSRIVTHTCSKTTNHSLLCKQKFTILNMYPIFPAYCFSVKLSPKQMQFEQKKYLNITSAKKMYIDAYIHVHQYHQAFIRLWDCRTRKAEKLNKNKSNIL